MVHDLGPVTVIFLHQLVEIEAAGRAEVALKVDIVPVVAQAQLLNDARAPFSGNE